MIRKNRPRKMIKMDDKKIVVKCVPQKIIRKSFADTDGALGASKQEPCCSVGRNETVGTPLNQGTSYLFISKVPKRWRLTWTNSYCICLACYHTLFAPVKMILVYVPLVSLQIFRFDFSTTPIGYHECYFSRITTQ